MFTIERNTDNFEPGGCEKLTSILTYILDEPTAHKNKVLFAGMRLAKILTKSENNKGDPG